MKSTCRALAAPAMPLMIPSHRPPYPDSPSSISLNPSPYVRIRLQRSPASLLDATQPRATINTLIQLQNDFHTASDSYLPYFEASGSPNPPTKTRAMWAVGASATSMRTCRE